MIRNKGKTLKGQIVLMFLLIGLSPLFAASILSFYSSQKTLKQVIGTLEQDLSIEVMDKIDREMENARLLVRNWGRIPEVLEIVLAGGQKPAHELLNSWKHDGLTSTSGAKLLKTLQQTAPNRFEEIFLTDRRGYVVAATNKTSDFDQGPEDDPPSGEPWWVAARTKGEHIGDVDFDESADIYSVDINISIKTDGGQIVGIIKAVYNVENIRNLIGAVSETDTRHYELINRNGFIVATRETERDRILEDRSSVVLPKAVWTNQTHKNGFIVGVKDAEKVLVGWSRGSAWTVLTYIPLEAAYTPLKQQGRWLMAVSAIAAVIILVIAVVVANRVVSELLGKELMAREIQTAEDMQMGLLPKALDISGLDLAGRCLSANHVGGDYYNYLWLDSDRTKLAIVIADVAGHDMAAAIPAVMFSGMLEFAVKEGTPGAMLCALNRMLCQQPKRTPFITCCVAVIDLAEKQMLWSKAGHPGIYHCRPHTDTVYELASESYPLGVSGKSRYTDEAVSLSEGDLLIFYTDGLTEVLNINEEAYDYDRLEKSILSIGRSGISSVESINRMIDDVRGFIQNREPEDDITLVVAKVT